MLILYTGMEGDYVYPEKYIEAFQKDYYRNGKFNLEVQAPHLAGLADHYKRKYVKTQDWRDCLKVFTLYSQFGSESLSRLLGVYKLKHV